MLVFLLYILTNHYKHHFFLKIYLIKSSILLIVENFKKYTI
jgi:hypothetical protein